MIVKAVFFYCVIILLQNQNHVSVQTKPVTIPKTPDFSYAVVKPFFGFADAVSQGLPLFFTDTLTAVSGFFSQRLNLRREDAQGVLIQPPQVAVGVHSTAVQVGHGKSPGTSF